MWLLIYNAQHLEGEGGDLGRDVARNFSSEEILKFFV